jgi:hypothetical protein
LLVVVVAMVDLSSGMGSEAGVGFVSVTFEVRVLEKGRFDCERMGF